MQPEDSRPRYLTPQDLADYTGIAVATLANWRTTGRGPAFVRVGRAIRYSRVTVDAWLVARTATSTSDADVKGVR